jgi:hypothetical protein
MTAAAGALELGLQVWLSPEMFEQSRETLLAYLVRAATAAESLRQRFPGRLVFCAGTESSLFTRGIVPGRSVGRRVANIRTAGLRSSVYAGPLQAFLAEASQRVSPVVNSEFGHSPYRGERSAPWPASTPPAKAPEMSRRAQPRQVEG